MDISSTLTPSENAILDIKVNSFNRSLSENVVQDQNLGKDDFLKILMTQLENQDPVKPMEDTQFIAQMAQFSSLEQMTNMSRELSELSLLLKESSNMNLVGRNVVIDDGDSTTEGIVKGVTGGLSPQILVNGKYFDASNVKMVTEGKE